MTPDFELVRASVASSLPGRVWFAVLRLTSSAWETSSAKTVLASVAARLPPPSGSARISAIAATIAVAAALQPLLQSLMPRTVRPAMPPYPFIAIAVLAALAAWRPGVIGVAWQTSWTRRRLRQARLIPHTAQPRR